MSSGLNEYLMMNNLYGNNINQANDEEQHEEDVNITNESSLTGSSNLQSDSSEFESAENNHANQNADDENDEHYDEHELEEEEEYEEDEQDEESVEQEKAKPIDNMYQQNCLAAAQMIQLMCSTASSVASSSSSSSNSSANQLETNSSNDVSPNFAMLTENEKENIPICKYCNKIFANFSNLNHHISAIHLNQSKWVCSQCGKICSSKSNLKVHLRVHLRVKPYHCRWCSYSCMHHSSIRDHLAKVHPDKTHTPLQPGYLFNSQAVPEPEVFNSQGFNANSFASESRMKRNSELANPPKTPLSNDKSYSPERRSFKKTKLSNESNKIVKSNQAQQVNPNIKPINRNQSPKPANLQSNEQSYASSGFAPFKPSQIQTPTIQTAISNNSSASKELNQANAASMSNLYNAYMARMFPFMYNPLQMQYAAAVASSQQQNQSTNAISQLPNHSSSNFFGMLNQNLQAQFGNHQSRSNQFSSSQYSTQEASNPNSNPFTSVFSNISSNNHSSSSSSSSSDELPTNSSYSASSRSSSLSPSNKTSSESKQMCTSSTSTGENHHHSPSIKLEKLPTTPQSDKHHQHQLKTSPRLELDSKPLISMKKSFNIEQMLNNSTANTKATKETQTDSSCLNCPYCSSKCL